MLFAQIIHSFPIHTLQELVRHSLSTTFIQKYMRGDGDGLRGGLFDRATGALIVSDDTFLSAGIPGYGAQASSPSAQIFSRYDHTDNTVGAIMIAGTPLSSNATTTTNEPTYIKLRVSIDGTTSAGHYTDTIYYTATVAL